MRQSPHDARHLRVRFYFQVQLESWESGARKARELKSIFSPGGSAKRAPRDLFCGRQKQEAFGDHLGGHTFERRELR